MYKNDVGVWTAPISSTLDMRAKVVTATTTHFGEWGVFGRSTEGRRTVKISSDSSVLSLTGGLSVVASLLAVCFVIVSS